MAVYDINGNELVSSNAFDRAVTIKPIDVGGNVIRPFNGDGNYYFNPYDASTSTVALYLYDENKEPLALYNSSNEVVNRMDISGPNKGEFNVQKRAYLTFSGTELKYILCISYEELVSGNNHGITVYHTDVIPSYMRIGERWTYGMVSDEDIAQDLYQVEYNNEKYLGFFDQIDDFVQKNMGDSVLFKSTEFGQKFVQETVYQINKTRSAMRIGTYNAYSAGQAQTNWACIKKQLMDFGLDICAFQEVRDPLNTVGTNKVWADEMTSWQFPYASSNGALYPVNERVALSKYEIVSSWEQQYERNGTDNRFLAKFEILLPAYQDRIGSDQLKLSVYSTQLEVASKDVAYAEAQEMLSIVATDKNPFIAICMDTNDFSIDKRIWKLIEDAGFTKCINPLSQTTRDQNDIIDQIFVNENMNPLNCDVINSKRYMYYKNGNNVAVSDHDLCFADIQFLYDNIAIVKQNLTNVSSDFDAPTVKLGDPLIITFTPNTGYEITGMGGKMGASWLSTFIENGTITYENGVLTIPSVTGDLNITPTTEATT